MKLKLPKINLKLLKVRPLEGETFRVKNVTTIIRKILKVSPSRMRLIGLISLIVGT